MGKYLKKLSFEWLVSLVWGREREIEREREKEGEIEREKERDKRLIL